VGIGIGIGNESVRRWKGKEEKGGWRREREKERGKSRGRCRRRNKVE